MCARARTLRSEPQTLVNVSHVHRNEVIGLLELANTFAPWWYAPVPVILVAGPVLRSPVLSLGGATAAAAFVATWWQLFAPRPPPRCTGA